MIVKILHEVKYKVQRVLRVLEYKYSPRLLYFSLRARAHACPTVLHRGTVEKGMHARGALGHACAQVRNAAVTPNKF